MVTLVIQVTERCNSGCVYCYQRPRGTATMTRETLATVFRRVGELLAARPDEAVELQWHGGEPLLLGPRFYRRAVELQRAHCGAATARVRHTVQTNLTCLTPRLLDELRALGLRAVGTSFDPAPHVRGPRDGEGWSRHARLFLRGLALVERCGLEYGIIYVVTRGSLARPLEPFVQLVNLALAGAVHLNPVVDQREARPGGAAFAIAPSEYVAFLAATFPFWWAHRGHLPPVEPFTSLTRLLEGEPAPPAGVGSPKVRVAPDGTARAEPDRGAEEQPALGTLAADPLAVLLERAAAAARGVPAASLDACGGCAALRACRGGAGMDAFAQRDRVVAGSPWCIARRYFVEQVLEPVAGRRVAAA